jgi:hypothetical protein
MSPPRALPGRGASHENVSDTGGGFHTARDRARPELLWFMRHRDALGRWPVIAEEWARRVEEHHQAENGTANRDITYLHGAGR